MKKFNPDVLRRKAMEQTFKLRKISINLSSELTTFDDLVGELRLFQMLEKEKEKEKAIQNMRYILGILLEPSNIYFKQ